MKPSNSKCLVLNSDYSPLTVIGWKKALIWYLKYENSTSSGVEIIDFYKDDFIQGTSDKRFPIPAIIKTVRYYRINNQNVNFCRKNLFIRDNYTCQYCNSKQDYNKLTYDHIIPKSQWVLSNQSPTVWTNIVTACIGCNRKKGNRTPKQANMPLAQPPIVPKKNFKFLPITDYLLTIRSEMPQEWTYYLSELYHENKSG